MYFISIYQLCAKAKPVVRQGQKTTGLKSIHI